MQQVTVQEQVEYASLGWRFAAVLVDTVVLFGLLIIAMMVYILVLAAQGRIDPQDPAAVQALSQDLGVSDLMANVVVFGALFVYYAVLESIFGASVGKLVFRMRVVMADGSRPTGSAVIVRNLVRIPEAWLLYIPAGISCLASGRRQRLGDHAARTVVVRRRLAAAGGGAAAGPPAPPAPAPPRLRAAGSRRRLRPAAPGRRCSGRPRGRDRAEPRRGARAPRRRRRWPRAAPTSTTCASPSASSPPATADPAAATRRSTSAPGSRSPTPWPRCAPRWDAATAAAVAAGRTLDEACAEQADLAHLLRELTPYASAETDEEIHAAFLAVARWEASDAPLTAPRRRRGWPLDVRGTMTAVSVDSEGAVMARESSTSTIRARSLLAVLAAVVAAGAAALLAPAAAAAAPRPFPVCHPDRRSGRAGDRRRRWSSGPTTATATSTSTAATSARARTTRSHEQGAAGQPVRHPLRHRVGQGPLRGRVGRRAQPRGRHGDRHLRAQHHHPHHLRGRAQRRRQVVPGDRRPLGGLGRGGRRRRPVPRQGARPRRAEDLHPGHQQRAQPRRHRQPHRRVAPRLHRRLHVRQGQHQRPQRPRRRPVHRLAAQHLRVDARHQRQPRGVVGDGRPRHAAQPQDGHAQVRAPRRAAARRRRAGDLGRRRARGRVRRSPTSPAPRSTCATSRAAPAWSRSPRRT